MSVQDEHPRVKLVIYNLDQLVEVCLYRQKCLKGPLQDGISILQRKDSIGLTVIINQEGNIEYVDYDDKIPFRCKENCDKLIDGFGCSLIPGLVDAHVHPIWTGDRCFELDFKSRGGRFMKAHEQDESIYYTVQETNKADHDFLLEKLKQTVNNMIRNGTTTFECKTGYGLNYESECKQLKIANDLKKQMSDKIDVVITFLGAYAVPENMSSEEGVSEILAMMKKLKEEHSNLDVDFVDVLCERGVYNVEQSRRVLLTGVHSLSHGEHIREKGIQSMANAGTTLILCPSTVHILKISPPPIRRMIMENIPIAIVISDFKETGTNYCPSVMCYSMPTAMHFAVMKCGLTVNEALAAATINSAHALNCSDRLGSIEVGKQADLLLLNCSDFRHLIYQFGDSRSLIKHVIKKGNII